MLGGSQPGPIAHASTHVTGGTDVIVPASASTAGLLKQLSGNTTDFVDGTNACQNLKTAIAQIGAAPTGSIMDFAGSTAPAGWLLCDGTAVSRTTYAALFAVLSTTYGTGDGSTTFNLPDCRGRSSIGVGAGAGLTNRVLNARGGEENHPLSTAELASHSHSIAAGQFNHSHGASDAGHSHGIPISGSSTYDAGGGGGTVYWIQPGGGLYPTQNASASITVAANTIPAGTTDANGSGTAHNTMMPFIALNKIIKT
jgi:microcystin-dependent protein